MGAGPIRTFFGEDLQTLIPKLPDAPLAVEPDPGAIRFWMLVADELLPHVQANPVGGMTFLRSVELDGADAGRHLVEVADLYAPRAAAGRLLEPTFTRRMGRERPEDPPRPDVTYVSDYGVPYEAANPVLTSEDPKD